MLNINMTPAKKKFVELAQADYGEGGILTSKDVYTISREKHKIGWPSWFVRSPYKVGKGQFKLPTLDGLLDVENSTVPIKENVVETTTTEIPDTRANLMI